MHDYSDHHDVPDSDHHDVPGSDHHDALPPGDAGADDHHDALLSWPTAKSAEHARSGCQVPFETHADWIIVDLRTGEVIARTADAPIGNAYTIQGSPILDIRFSDQAPIRLAHTTGSDVLAIPPNAAPAPSEVRMPELNVTAGRHAGGHQMPPGDTGSGGHRDAPSLGNAENGGYHAAQPPEDAGNGGYHAGHQLPPGHDNHQPGTTTDDLARLAGVTKL